LADFKGYNDFKQRRVIRNEHPQTWRVTMKASFSIHSTSGPSIGFPAFDHSWSQNDYGFDLKWQDGEGTPLNSCPFSFDEEENRDATDEPGFACGTYCGSQFIGQQLSGADFSHSKLNSANFNGALLRMTDFTNADLGKASFTNADLTLARMSGANLSGSDFRSADLTHVDLSSALLVGADFSNADLQNANLSIADLRGANLSGVELGSVNLTDAIYDEKTILPLSAKGLGMRFHREGAINV
jgi:hypothetical protein